jgi:hypothetical protein
MSEETSNLIKRLKAKGHLKLAEGLEQSGETRSGNDKVKVSDWSVSLSAEGDLASGCKVTPISTKNPIWYMTLSLEATGTNKLAALASVQPAAGSGNLGAEGISLAAWTGLYDLKVDGNVIDSLIMGFVKTSSNTVEEFSFEQRFVIQ